jgi:hypothetical protein
VGLNSITIAVITNFDPQNRECQVADYPNHKVACRSNAAFREQIKGEDRYKEADSSGPPMDRKNVESRLKQWIQVEYLSLRLQECSADLRAIIPIRLSSIDHYWPSPSSMP